MYIYKYNMRSYIFREQTADKEEVLGMEVPEVLGMEVPEISKLIYPPTIAFYMIGYYDTCAVSFIIHCLQLAYCIGRIQILLDV